VEDACGEREDDGGEEEDELGAEQDLLEVVEESPQRRAGDLAEEGEVGLLAERGGGHVVGRAAEVAGGQLLGPGLEEPRGSGGGGGGVHAGAPAPPMSTVPMRDRAPVRHDDSPGWYFTAGSPTAGAAGSQPPSYATQERRVDLPSQSSVHAGSKPFLPNTYRLRPRIVNLRK
jgi:hypothetical protein